jgi:hypothetical protein
MSGTTTSGSTILNKIGDYAKTNFVVNWASGSVIFLAICYSVVMYYENTNLKNDIVKLKETVKQEVAARKVSDENMKTITVTFETMKTTVEAFRANPPSTYDEKINGIYRIIDIHHPSGHVNHNPPAFHSNQPNNTLPEMTEN